MRKLLTLLKYSLAAAVVTIVGSVIGMSIGCAVVLDVLPRPSSHFCGNDYLAGGALIGAGIGLAGVVAIAVKEIKANRQRPHTSESAS